MLRTGPLPPNETWTDALAGNPTSLRRTALYSRQSTDRLPIALGPIGGGDR